MLFDFLIPAKHFAAVEGARFIRHALVEIFHVIISLNSVIE